jgi:uncharacterized protein
MKETVEKIVLDTNIWVAAGFNPGSSSARIVAMIRSQELHLVWDQATRAETRQIINQIPPLHWEDIAGLFTPESEFTEPTDIDSFTMVPDPDDRKFAALAAAAGAILVSNDDHLLAVRDELPVRVLTPSELLREI